MFLRYWNDLKIEQADLRLQYIASLNRNEEFPVAELAYANPISGIKR